MKINLIWTPKPYQKPSYFLQPQLPWFSEKKLKMSASRLFFLLGPSIVRNCNNPTNISSPFSPIRFTKPLSSHVVRFRSYNCTSATIETNTIEPLVSPRNHPWPELVAFVDRLKSKGYIKESTSIGEDGDGSIYTNMNLLKDACLNFSRDRSDIFKWESSCFLTF